MSICATRIRNHELNVSPDRLFSIRESYSIYKPAPNDNPRAELQYKRSVGNLSLCINSVQ